jgi:hypothetical protein
MADASISSIGTDTVRTPIRLLPIFGRVLVEGAWLRWCQLVKRSAHALTLCLLFQELRVIGSLQKRHPNAVQYEVLQLILLRISQRTLGIIERELEAVDDLGVKRPFVVRCCHLNLLEQLRWETKRNARKR